MDVWMTQDEARNELSAIAQIHAHYAEGIVDDLLAEVPLLLIAVGGGRQVEPERGEKIENHFYVPARQRYVASTKWEPVEPTKGDET